MTRAGLEMVQKISVAIGSLNNRYFVMPRKSRPKKHLSRLFSCFEEVANIAIAHSTFKLKSGLRRK